MIDTPWLAYHQPNPRAVMRLFCFPFAGGGASAFRGWGHRFADTLEVCPVQLPGREGRLSEPPIHRMAPMVEALAQRLQGHMDRPFAFFGHSMGAAMAFALAHHLESQGAPAPRHLFVSAGSAPTLPAHDAPMHRASDAELVEELKRLGGTPPEILADPEWLELLLPLIRADFELLETYQPPEGTCVSCPVSAFGGLQDVHVRRDRLEAWRSLTSAGFTLRMVPGGHFYLQSALDPLAEAIGRDLDLVRPAH